MSERVAGRPYWTLRIDEDGDVDEPGYAALDAGVGDEGVTDLVVMCHGWNNDKPVAQRLYTAWFTQLGEVLDKHGATGRTVGFVGLLWPSMRWPDEPIPDFSPRAVADLAGGGAAGVGAPPEAVAQPELDSAELADLLADAFPGPQRAAARELADLLASRPDDPASLARAKELIDEIAAAAPQPAESADGEQDADAVPDLASPARTDQDVFDTFAGALESGGVAVGGASGAAAGGAAGIDLDLGRLWDGAREAARQLTYWRMKTRAGVVGRHGLGPALSRLLAEHDGLRVSLVGHSFGARVVSFALWGLADAAHGRVTGVTLLQGAFSHYAFAARLPHAADRRGLLAGKQDRVAGPVVACYSAHDSAVGRFYPLASTLSREDASALGDFSSRWGGIGANGHQPAGSAVRKERLRRTGEPYDFPAGSLVNVDAAAVVRRGRPPSGAHSDIVHPELAWVAACAAGLAR